MSLVKTELKAGGLQTTEPVCVERSTAMCELARVFEEHEIPRPRPGVERRIHRVIARDDKRFATGIVTSMGMLGALPIERSATPGHLPGPPRAGPVQT